MEEQFCGVFVKDFSWYFKVRYLYVIVFAFYLFTEYSLSRSNLMLTM